MGKTQLVFIPSTGVGHLISTVELAKLLVNRDRQLNITVLIIPSNFDSTVVDNYTNSVAASASLSNRIHLVHLSKDEPDSQPFSFGLFYERKKPQVKEAVSNIIKSESDSSRLAGFVLDMFCVTYIDVANDFGVPSYIFYTSSAAFLGFLLHMQVMYDEQNVDPAELKESGTEIEVPCLANPFPASSMPAALLKKEWLPMLFDLSRRLKDAEGIIVNTFFELETCAIESLSNGKFEGISAVYPVGPILNVGRNEESSKDQEEIMEWLDDQPASSVVFLCFGSMGSFGEEQVKEIAYALEQSGYRFLWSLRQPPPTGKVGITRDYENPQEVLPEGFLERTNNVGKVIGWAPQAAVLAHVAIGGFVSHCGWNSLLESIWYGVPIAAWPLHSDQQFNAFEMVIELGLAYEIKIDYTTESGIVSCEEIKKGITRLMEEDSEKRKKVKEMSERSRLALIEGGSSCIWLDRFIINLMDNLTENN